MDTDPLTPTLEELAQARSMCRFEETRNRGYPIDAYVLFDEPPRHDAAPEAHRHRDGVVVIRRSRTPGAWFPTVVRRTELELVEVLPEEPPPPVDFRAPHGWRTNPRALAEAVAVAAKYALRVELRYHAKDAKPGAYTDKDVTIVGHGIDLVFVLDHGKGRALRSYRIDGIAQLYVPRDRPAPVWNERLGYTYDTRPPETDHP